jgi:hypothetical protein
MMSFLFPLFVSLSHFGFDTDQCTGVLGSSNHRAWYLETVLSVDLLLVRVVVDHQVEVANTVKKLLLDTPSLGDGYILNSGTHHTVVQRLKFLN